MIDNLMSPMFGYSLLKAKPWLRFFSMKNNSCHQEYLKSFSKTSMQKQNLFQKYLPANIY